MEEQEISLRELIEVLLKRKKIIFIVTAIALIAGVVVSFMITPIYKVSGKMQLANYEGSDLTNINYAAQVLSSRDTYRAVLQSLNIDMRASDLKKKLEVNIIKDTNIIELSLEHPSSDEAALILNTLMELYKEMGKGDLQRYQNKLQAELKNVEGEIVIGNKIIEEVAKTIEDLKNKGQRVYLEQSLAISEMHKYLYDNQTRVYDLNLRLIELENKSNSIKGSTKIESAVPAKDPIKPNKKVNIAIAGVLGIMLGVFIAFFGAYWESAAEPSESSKDTALS
ncbi:MAG: hypothetical protein JM58_08340 [Peptococcaceae bacterium BICA1-8]|nr:MAG: hypothetical protein JM58_08340 [Peptococcaceae bacterium BICA1-8]